MGGVFLLLGTNLGNRKDNLHKATDLISREMGPVVRASGIYRTGAGGIEDQDDFLNQVVEITTTLEPASLIKKALEIEENMGRVRREKWGSRLIDIDILLYGDKVVAQPGVTIPHPGIPDRRFTLVPLAELAPDLVHPVLKKSIQTLLDECKDDLEVEKQ